MSDNDEATLIWNEYQYRHEHCWKTIFKLTGAAVLLGVVPYLDFQNARALGLWLISPPSLAVALILFAILRMRRELSLLSQVRGVHRERQRGLHGFTFPKTRLGSFSQHVTAYLWILFTLAAANVVIAVCHFPK